MKKIILAFTFVFLVNTQSKAQFNLSWATSLGGNWNQMGTHVTTDASGNVYSVGTFSDTSDLDPTAGTQVATPEGGEDIYVIKQSSTGSLIWAKSFGGSNMDSPAGVAVDGSGNVYISGTYGGAIDLDPSASTYTFFTGSVEVFVLKLNASGNFVWGASIGGGANDFATAMCIDASGNVYTAGTFEGMMDFDPGPGSYPITPFGSSGTDVFVSKLDASGNFVWAVNLGGTSSEQPHSICVDALFNVYTTGYFQDVADFDPGAGTFTLSAVGQQNDAFVSKLDPNGSFVWAKQFGGTNFEEGTCIVSDAGNIYITGEYSGIVDFDPGVGTFTLSPAPTSTTPAGAFAVKLSNAGNFVWAKSIGGTQNAEGDHIRIATGGNIYWSGEYNGTADLDPGAGTYTLSSSTGYDTFLIVLDGSGNFIKAETFPYVWTSFVVNSSGEIMITGWFYNGDFDPSTSVLTLNSTGATDACIVKLNQVPTVVSEFNFESASASIYPNPNSGSFVISVPENSQMRIVNAVGVTVMEYPDVIGTQQVNLKDSKSGIYFLMINTNGKQTTKKFVIEN